MLNDSFGFIPDSPQNKEEGLEHQKPVFNRTMGSFGELGSPIRFQEEQEVPKNKGADIDLDNFEMRVFLKIRELEDREK